MAMTPPPGAQMMGVPTNIAPSPVPLVIDVKQQPDGRGGFVVVMKFDTPLGVNFFFMDSAAAVKVAGDLEAAGRAGHLQIARA